MKIFTTEQIVAYLLFSRSNPSYAQKRLVSLGIIAYHHSIVVAAITSRAVKCMFAGSSAPTDDEIRRLCELPLTQEKIDSFNKERI